MLKLNQGHTLVVEGAFLCVPNESPVCSFTLPDIFLFLSFMIHYLMQSFRNCYICRYNKVNNTTLLLHWKQVQDSYYLHQDPCSGLCTCRGNKNFKGYSITVRYHIQHNCCLNCCVTTACQRSCGKVMSFCSGGPHVTITHDALNLTI